MTLPIFLDPPALDLELGAPDLRVVEVGPESDYLAGHIPGAHRVDYADLVDGGEPAPGRLPAPERLAALCARLALGAGTRVVGYDRDRGGRACRLLWTLHVAGQQRVTVLNGGLSAWAGGGLRLEPGPGAATAAGAASRGALRLADGAERVADIAYVRSRIGDAGTVLLDVQSPAEFSGADRRAARGGHIPGAVNLDWNQTMDARCYDRILEPAALRERLAACEVTPDKEIIVYCHTHHRSAHTYAVLKHLGYPRVRGYAGSWSEWGNREDTPVAQ